MPVDYGAYQKSIEHTVDAEAFSPSGGLRRDKIAAGRAEAKLAQAQANAQLQQLQNPVSPGVSLDDQTKFFDLQEKIRKSGNEILKMHTQTAISAFEATNSPKAMNKLINDNKEMYHAMDVYEVDALKDTPEHRRLMAEAGYNPEQVYANTKRAREIRRSLMVVKTSAGWTLRNRAASYALTLDKDTFTQWSKIQKIDEGSGVTRNTIAKYPNLTKGMVAAMKVKLNQMRERLGGTADADPEYLALKKDIQVLDEYLNPKQAETENSQSMQKRRYDNLSEITKVEDALKEDPDNVNLQKKLEQLLKDRDNYKAATGDPSRITYADAAERAYDETITALSEAGLSLDSPMSEIEKHPKVAERLRANARRILTITNEKFTSEQRRTFKTIKALMKLGESSAENVTPENTGFFDSFLKDIKKYFSDDTTGLGGVASYTQFRLLLIKDITGAQITNTEKGLLDKAFVTLGLKHGPVLVSLKTSLEKLRAEMEGLVGLNNPIVAKAFAGGTLEELDDLIAGVDNIITTKYEANTTVEQNTRPNSIQAELESIHSGSN